MLIGIGKNKRHIMWIQKMINVFKKGELIKVKLNLIR